MCPLCNGKRIVIRHMSFGVLYRPCPVCQATEDDDHPGQRFDEAESAAAKPA